MRRRALLAVLAVLSLVAIGCDLRLAVPPGTAPVRYRDLVFTTVTTTSNVVYGSAPNQQGQTVSLALDVYKPVGDTITSRPAIVWVHGGSFSSGDKTSPELVDEATTFAKKGFVNVSINYRLSSGCSAGTPTPACVTSIVDAKHDAQAAVRFLRANAATYGVDANRIAVAGTSAGAITALNVGFDPTEPGSSGNPGYSSAVNAAVSLSGAAVLTTPSSGDAPSLLFHGTADTVVPYQWALNTQTQATAAGLTCELTSWTGAGHVPYAQHRDEILDQTTNFLYWTMNLPSAAH
jgi:acetyl esterase/lipase